MTERKFVQITLIVEDAGTLESHSDDLYSTHMYTLSDPNGVLDGELELVCTPYELDRELKNLNAVPVYAKEAPKTGVSTTTTVAPGTKTVVRKAALEAPPDVSAGTLVNRLAKETGTVGVFTALLSDLIDDLLRPQEVKKK